jgi:hypothetical protein
MKRAERTGNRTSFVSEPVIVTMVQLLSSLNPVVPKVVLPARKFSITTGVSNGLNQRIKVEVQKATKILYHSKSGSKALYNLATHPQEHPRAPPTRCGNPTATISIRGEIRSAYYAPPIAAELVGPYTAAVEAVLAFCLPREGCPSTSPAKSRSVLSDEAPKASSGSEKLTLNAE